MRACNLILVAILFFIYSCGGESGPSSGIGGGTSGGSPTATTGSISFTSADTNGIGRAGSGQDVDAVVSFKVIDDLGSAISGATVTFTLIGPNGGESINPTSTTTSSNGTASTTLTSGSVSGPVTIKASVTLNGTVISTPSSVISIGGGVPSASHFNIAAETLNLYGLIRSGLTTTLTAFIADRFGNFNVLDGTSVSFYTEAGAVFAFDTTSNTTPATDGEASVTFKTQAPSPTDVAIIASEVTTINSLNLAVGSGGYALGYATDGSDGHPRDGRLTVLATVQGEETFIDTNGNGVYDVGETFTDVGEPFIDANDNGTWDDGTGTDPEEIYIDSNNSGAYNGPNTVWDGPDCPVTASCQESKMIWDLLNMAFTGNASICAIDQASGIAIAANGSQVYNFMVSDFNLNRPIPGTTIDVTLSGGGELFGLASYTVPDGVPSGPYIVSVSVGDADTDATVEAFSLTFEVTSDDIVTCAPVTVTGTVL